MRYSLRSLMTFSIRDLLWLTVVVAVLAAWWIDRLRLAAEIDRLGTVVVDHSLGTVYSGPPMPNSSAPAPNPPKP
jgi:hypothetical protein